MSSTRAAIAGLVAAASVVSAASTSVSDYAGLELSIVEVDVAVIGGGGAGAHAALRLHDAEVPFVLVEAQAWLGGHVNTYIDPTTGTPYDYGVNSYTNYTGVVEFFARIGVPTKSPVHLPLHTTYADFNTGNTIVYDTPPNSGAALMTFYQLCLQYQDLILPSYANFPTDASAIPEDLVLPFSQFVEKHAIQDAVPTIYEVTGLGMGDMMDSLTMYVMATFGGPITGSLLGDVGSFVPASGRNQDIYDAIASILGDDDVLYSTKVLAAQRNASGVTLVTQSLETGDYTLILAKKLLMAIEPTPANMEPFNLDSAESAVFAEATWSTVHAGIVYNPSLPVGGSLTNIPASASPDNYTDFEAEPFVGRFDYMGDENFRVLVMGPLNFETCAAQSLANKALQTLAVAGTINATSGGLTIKAWSNHGALSMRTTADNVEAGYITKQKALQDHLSTFWTGGAFSTQLSTTLWAYNDEYLLPMLYACL